MDATAPPLRILGHRSVTARHSAQRPATWATTALTWPPPPRQHGRQSDPATVTPTALPTTLAPTGTQLCAPYSVTNNNSASQYYSICNIYACPGATIMASGCSSTYSTDLCGSLYSSVSNVHAARELLLHVQLPMHHSHLGRHSRNTVSHISWFWYFIIP